MLFVTGVKYKRMVSAVLEVFLDKHRALEYSFERIEGGAIDGHQSGVRR
jgi:hypothetical protein